MQFEPTEYRKPPRTAPMLLTPPGLLISNDKRDLGACKSVFERLSRNLLWAPDFQHAIEYLNHVALSIVITERDLDPYDWKDVFHIAQSPTPPPLVIVISRFADEYLWAEVLNLGGYDVLSKPLDGTELTRVLEYAWARSDRDLADHRDLRPRCAAG